ncbi:hypothetical protein ACLKMH_01545 [Psychromonas sp. KJ10-10]|uniref:hypothetical protein n=1 Tax=Psychromonas sp. KJ10-10 TaxID=3391823 RepID=UPI0039B373C1
MLNKDKLKDSVLPIIDITGYATADLKLQKQLACKIKQACSDKGFFILSVTVLMIS